MNTRHKFYSQLSCVVAVLFATAAMAVVDVGKMGAKPAVVAEAALTVPAVDFTVATVDVATPAQMVNEVVSVPVTAAMDYIEAKQTARAIFDAGADGSQELRQFNGG